MDATSEQGVTHNIPLQEASTIHFFGLDGYRSMALLISDMTLESPRSNAWTKAVSS